MVELSAMLVVMCRSLKSEINALWMKATSFGQLQIALVSLDRMKLAEDF